MRLRLRFPLWSRLRLPHSRLPHSRLAHTQLRHAQLPDAPPSRAFRPSLRLACLSLACLLLTCMLSACATTPRTSAMDAVTFIVVRHAEKQLDDTPDPALTSAGQARARTLATLLQKRDVVAAYATDFRRTQQTAQPVAQAHGLAVIAYDADGPAAPFAARLQHDHATGTVLVVGHSNTVPDIVSALCKCVVAPIDERDYGNLYDVRIERDTEPVLSQRRY